MDDNKPFPWGVYPRRDEDVIKPNSINSLLGEHPLYSADEKKAWDDHDKEMARVARVRDAAEEMLKVLKDFVSYMGDGESPGEARLLDNAREVIRKAQGIT